MNKRQIIQQTTTEDSLSEIYQTLNILCVEDDEDILDIYKELFSLLFNKVYFATDGEEGIKSFHENEIDIILTDYMMPNCNGLQMAKTIRQEDSSIPIILVTAIENIEVLKEAIDLNITSFLKKPFEVRLLFSTFNLAVKSVLADRCIFKQQTEQILYNHYQESLTFDKEITIAKNDIKESQKLLDFNCNVFYKPKDTLSGDSYLIKEISEDEYFFFIVDGMGKGISASVTAMLCSAFINYYIESIKEKKQTFSLKLLLEELLRFIQPNLLENEVVSTSLFYIQNKTDEMEYAIFSMPPSLYLLQGSDEVHKIRSNNTPLASYTTSYNIDTLNISKMTKLITYSDGLNESTHQDDEDQLYNIYLKKDFLTASDIDTLNQLFIQRGFIHDDDTTYIFLSRNNSSIEKISYNCKN